jgi:sirohydrochlorin cobaltochelatase
MAREQGVAVPDVAGAIASVRAAGRFPVVQPILVLAGAEYERKIVAQADGAPVGRALLHEPDDARVLARLLARESAPQRDELVVLVGHGSHHGADDRYAQLQKALDAIGHSWLVGTIEGQIGLEEAIAGLRARAGRRPGDGPEAGPGASTPPRVRIRPLMLTAGDHVVNDIAGAEESWLRALAGAGFETSYEDETLLDSEAVRALFAARSRELVFGRAGEGGAQ